MQNINFMVFFRNPMDSQLRLLLNSYLAKDGELEFAFCTEWEQNGVFIYMKLAKAKQDNEWGINVPAASVLSIADFSAQKPIGFTSKAKPKTSVNTA